MKKIFTTILLMNIAVISFSQGKSGFQALISHENDVFGISNKDENYTGGLKLEVLTPQWGKFWQPFFRFKNEGSLNIQRFAFGGTGYTPQDIAISSIIINDRPYASLVYGSIGNTSFSSTNKWLVQSELIFGVMGSKGPGKLQAHIHRNNWLGSTRPIPLGWDNQIGYNKAFVINYNTRVQYFLSNIDFNERLSLLQTSLTGRLDFGTYMINLQAGVKLNIFNLNSSVLHDYNPSYPVLTPQVHSVQSKKIRFNLFIEPQVRLAAFNATLEGLMFNDQSVYKIPSSEVKRLLFELNAGFNLQLYDVLYLKFMLFARSREFEEGKPVHIWGGITIGGSPSSWNNN